jgi:hypothetical protein
MRVHALDAPEACKNQIALAVSMIYGAVENAARIKSMRLVLRFGCGVA